MGKFGKQDLRELPVPMDDGHWISERVERTAYLVRQYDERLDVVWCPPETRRDKDEPQFFVVEKMADGRRLPVLSILNESVMDERVLEELIKRDQEKQGHGNEFLKKLDAKNAAVRAMQQQEALDRREEMKDMVAHIIASPKSKYVVDVNGAKKIFRD